MADSLRTLERMIRATCVMMIRTPQTDGPRFNMLKKKLQKYVARYQALGGDPDTLKVIERRPLP